MADIYTFSENDEAYLGYHTTESVEWPPATVENKKYTNISDEDSDQQEVDPKLSNPDSTDLSSILQSYDEFEDEVVRMFESTNVREFYSYGPVLDKKDYNPYTKFIDIYIIYEQDEEDKHYDYETLPSISKANAGIVMARMLYATLLFTIEEMPDCIDNLVLKVIELFKYEGTDVTIELMEQVPQLVELCQRYPILNSMVARAIVPRVKSELFNSTFMGRSATQNALVVLLEQKLVDRAFLCKDLLPAILKHADCSKSEADQMGVEAVTVLMKICRVMGSEFTSKYLGGSFMYMCSNANHNVRRVCVNNYVEVCSVLDESQMDNKTMVRIFMLLCKDPNWTVRKRCMEIFVDVAKLTSLKTKKEVLVPNFISFLEDESNWVRVAAFSTLGPFISTFAVPGETPVSVCIDADGSLRVEQNKSRNSLRQKSIAVQKENPVFNEINFWKTPLPVVDLPTLNLDGGATSDDEIVESPYSDSESCNLAWWEENDYLHILYDDSFLVDIEQIVNVDSDLSDHGMDEASPDWLDSLEFEVSLSAGDLKRIDDSNRSNIDENNTLNEASNTVSHKSISDNSLNTEYTNHNDSNKIEECDDSPITDNPLNTEDTNPNDDSNKMGECDDSAITEANEYNLNIEDENCFTQFNGNTNHNDDSNKMGEYDDSAINEANEYNLNIEDENRFTQFNGNSVHIESTHGGVLNEFHNISSGIDNSIYQGNGNTHVIPTNTDWFNYSDDESIVIGTKDDSNVHLSDSYTSETEVDNRNVDTIESNLADCEDCNFAVPAPVESEADCVQLRERNCKSDLNLCAQRIVRQRNSKSADTIDANDIQNERDKMIQMLAKVLNSSSVEKLENVDSPPRSHSSWDEIGLEDSPGDTKLDKDEDDENGELLIEKVYKEDCWLQDYVVETRYIFYEMTEYNEERIAYETKVSLLPMQHIVPQELLKIYLMLVFPPYLMKDKDDDKKVNCAFSLPAVALTVGSQCPDFITHIYNKLAFDKNWKVRRTLAASIHEMALILGEERADNFLFDIFNHYIDDIVAVRHCAIRSLSAFMKALSPHMANLLLPKLKSFWAENNNAVEWRLNLTLVQQISNIADIVSTEDCSTYLCPIICLLMDTNIVMVRRSCYPVISKLMKIMYEDDHKQLCGDGHKQYLRQFSLSIRENALSETWWKRQDFVFIAKQIITDKCIPICIWYDMFFIYLLRLVNDKVPNVRMAVAKIIVNSNSLGILRFEAKMEEVLETLRGDSDRDVRQSCELDQAGALVLPS